MLQGQGQLIADADRQIGVTQQTYYRWRKQYGGMGRDQLLRLKELEKKNLGLLGQSQIWRLINSYFRLRRNRGRRPRKSGEEAGELLSPARRRRCIVQRNASVRRAHQTKPV